MDFSDSDDLDWSDTKKRAYVWQSLVKSAQANESNSFYYHIVLVTTGEGDHDPVLLSRSEHKAILKDFEFEGKLQIIPDETEYDFSETPDPNVLQVELKDSQKKRKSVYSNIIHSFSDLIKDMKLRAEVQSLLTMSFGVYDVREIRNNQGVETDIKEEQDELLLLLEELGFVEIKWESLKQQTHRMIGNRYIRVYFKGDVAKKFADALYGKSSVIRPQALEQVAYVIKDTMSQDGLSEAFLQIGVPYSLVMESQGSKKEVVYNILTALSSTGDEEDTALFYKILEEFAHPLMFGGNTKSAVDFQYKITKIIRYDGFSLFGGKVHEFNDEDGKQITELEKEENKVSPELSNVFSEIFGGNPFTGAKQQPENAQHSKDAKQKTPDTHIHIYNNNQNNNVQTVSTAEQQPTQRQNNSGAENDNTGLSPKLKWEQIEIKFKNGHDVSIKYGDKEKDADYKEMGFEDSKKNAPNTQWGILKHMAENERFISFNDGNKYTKALKNQKMQLSEKLQKYFGIKEDPFEYIKSEVETGYLALLDLKPEKDSRKTYLGDIG